jgi:hypothetical protein
LKRTSKNKADRAAGRSRRNGSKKRQETVAVMIAEREQE